MKHAVLNLSPKVSWSSTTQCVSLASTAIIQAWCLARNPIGDIHVQCMQG